LERAIRERVGGETGPTFAESSRRMVMAYPSPYRVGMSSLGYQRVTTLLRAAGIGAERCFLPDDAEAWRRSGVAPVTYENGAPLSSFPLVAFSFAYETELLGLVELLEMSGIPPLRQDRTADHPLILLGGPISMASPAFLADFVDAALLGEGEDVVVPGVEALYDAGDRDAWLDAIEALPGGWVPERTGARLPPLARASDAHLPARSAWLCPEAELADMFLVEGERGCHRMCTFCVMRRTTNGGMRLVSPEGVLELVPRVARKVGLVGAAISDHPALVELLEVLVRAGRTVSVSSLRADQIARKPAIGRLLRESGARTLTTASDGASERIRRTIRKGTTEAHLAACADQAASTGFATLKLYMMLGVPTETDEDVDELIASTTALARRAAPARVVLGVAPFVAKRGTPLDGLPFAGIDVIDDRVRRLRRGLRGAAEVRPTSARWGWIEFALAQGGSEAGRALYEGWRAGGRFADLRDALRSVDPASGRPWARHEAPLVDVPVHGPILRGGSPGGIAGAQTGG
jgi:radical SAM superfamily enzyme YgiQ (UPF0313 family)